MSDETHGSDSDDRSSAKPPAPSRGRKPAGRRNKDAEATAAGSESPQLKKTVRKQAVASAELKKPAPRKRPARKADATLSPTARRTVSRTRIARAVLDRYRRR